MIAFRQTDLPVPVRPAMSRWGMSARSYDQRPALDVLAEEQRDLALRPPSRRPPAITSLRRTIGRCSLGTSMPTVFLPGIGATMRTLGTRRASARSSARLVTLLSAQAGFQLDLVLGDDRAGVDADDLDR